MRLNLLLAAGITVFVTVLVAAIVQHMVARPLLTNDTSPLPTATLFVPTVAPQATPRPVVDAEAVQQREATFQARLAAANDAIAASAAELAAAKQAQAELASKYNALAQQQQQRQAPLQVMVTATPAVVAQAQASTDTPVYASMDAVLATLQSQNPAAVLLQQPEMVMYENNVAYEFVFDMGTVYVTASDGALLYDGIAMNARAVADAGRNRDRNPPPGRRGDGDHHRHNDDDDDEDEHAETHETEDEHEDEGGDDD